MTVVWLGIKFYKPIKVTVGESSAPRGSTGGPLLLIFREQCGTAVMKTPVSLIFGQVRFRQFLKELSIRERFACDGDGGGEAAVCCWRTVASI